MHETRVCGKSNVFFQVLTHTARELDETVLAGQKTIVASTPTCQARFGDPVGIGKAALMEREGPGDRSKR